MEKSYRTNIVTFLFFISLSLFLMPRASKAQIETGISPQAGVSYFGGNNKSNNSFGVISGLEGYLKYNISHRWSLRGGVGYDFMHNKIDYNGPLDPQISETLNNFFVTVPIELVISPNGNWNISVGAEYKMLLNNQDVIEKEDLRYALSLGVSQALGKGSIGLKFSYGLKDLISTKTSKSVHYEYQGTPITIKLLYRIPIRKKKED